MQNDFNHASINEHKSTRVFNAVKTLVDMNCGIESVGFQSHVDIDFSDFDGVRQNIQRYAGIGVSVQFTGGSVQKNENREF